MEAEPEDRRLPVTDRRAQVVGVAIIAVALVAIGAGIMAQGSASTVAAVDRPSPAAMSADPDGGRWIDYQVRSTQNGTREFCTKLVDPNVVILGHIRGCAEELILIRPSRVDCGLIHGRASATDLASAVLAQTALRAKDLGAIEPGTNVPLELFRKLPVGRVIDIGRSRRFDRTMADPDQCRLAATVDENGGVEAETPVVEVRGDMTARYILFDAPSGLVVVAASLGGHDLVSGRDADDRGYGGGGMHELTHILEQIYDLQAD